MAKANTNRDTYHRLLKLLVDFDLLLIKEPPLRERFLLSCMSKQIIHEYYLLKKEIKKNKIDSPFIKQLVRNMPVHVWLLRKYAMEITLGLIAISVIIPYFMFIPTFNGQLSFYIAGTFLVWYFFRRVIYNLNSDLNYIISELIKEIKKELKTKKVKQK